MASYTINIEEKFAVPRDKVFALFADHQRFGKLLGAPVKRVRDSDQDDPNGVGSVRRIGVGALGLEETVLGFEPGRLIEYTLTSPSPIRNHFGRIQFEDSATGGTQLRYTITFDDIVPFSGKAIQVVLEQGLRRSMRKVSVMA